jgi:hypothetical protein
MGTNASSRNRGRTRLLTKGRMKDGEKAIQVPALHYQNGFRLSALLEGGNKT